MTQLNNLKEYIQTIKKSSESQTFELKASTGNTLQFSCMNVLQHKRIMETGSSSFAGMKNFRKELYLIMQENILNNTEDVRENILESDFLNYLVLNRYYSLSDKYEGKRIEIAYLIEEYDKIIEYDKNMICSLEDIKIIGSIPKFKKINFMETHSKVVENSTNGKLTSDIYHSEILKFIDGITIGDKHYSFSGLSYEERYEYIMELPSKLLHDLSVKVSDYNNWLSEQYKFKLEDIDILKVIPLDISLYFI